MHLFTNANYHTNITKKPQNFDKKCILYRLTNKK